ncbi:Peptidyl-prolyl isomerase cwc27 [Eufriesea mexicana]|nr:Peptidyl-prolyl isomerase cwc27 [Eufriesea mexicana]
MKGPREVVASKRMELSLTFDSQRLPQPDLGIQENVIYLYPANFKILGKAGQYEIPAYYFLYRPANSLYQDIDVAKSFAKRWDDIANATHIRQLWPMDVASSCIGLPSGEISGKADGSQDVSRITGDKWQNAGEGITPASLAKLEPEISQRLLVELKERTDEGENSGLNDSDEETNDRPLYPPRLITTRILNNPFSDIIPRIIVQESEEVKDNSKTETAARFFNLLSFGEEAEEDEEESVILNKKFSAVEPPGPPNKKTKKDCNSNWESDDEVKT